MANIIKNYKCPRCKTIKQYISGPFLSDKRNIIADNCPECFLGSMVIDLDDEINFDDNYLSKYQDSMLNILGEGGYDGLI